MEEQWIQANNCPSLPGREGDVNLPAVCCAMAQMVVNRPPYFVAMCLMLQGRSAMDSIAGNRVVLWKCLARLSSMLQGLNCVLGFLQVFDFVLCYCARVLDYN